jgi:hypothetical protein
LLFNKGLDKSNELDAQPTNEMSFRIKNLTKNIPTLDKLKKIYKQELDTAAPCNTKIEDQYHIWNCENSIDHLHQLNEYFLKLLQKGPSTHDWKKLLIFNTKPTESDLSLFSQ